MFASAGCGSFGPIKCTAGENNAEEPAEEPAGETVSALQA